MSEKVQGESMASLGGKARAAKMTAEQRRESAKKAAETRWANNLPRATHGSEEHPLRISGIDLPCYVLDDGRRVLVMSSMLQGLDMSLGSAGGGEGDRLARFVAGKSISPYVSQDLVNRINDPIRFVNTRGRTVFGYEATILADLCEAVLSARHAGALRKIQKHIADRCEILVRGFARVGIIALVDEATGYQQDRQREELRLILEQYVSKELARWERAFEVDFYKHVYRLRGWQFNPDSTKRTHQVARVTVDLIYDRIHPDLLKELKQMRGEKGKPSQKLHQWLTTGPGGGHPRLKQHNEGVTALLSVAQTWGQFMEWVDTRYPKLNQTMRIPFVDTEDEVSAPPSV